MDDLRLGATVRLLRRRRGWRQEDLGRESRCSRATVSRVERGHIGSVSVDALRRVAAALDLRIDPTPRWRGGELDRLLNREHSALGEDVARRFEGHPGWTFAPEVSFAVYGERGVIDLLAWHAAQGMLAIVELKTAIVDVQDLLAAMDRRRRLARSIAHERGWNPVGIAAVVIVSATRTNRRHVADHRAILRAACPSDGRRLDGWLRDPRAAASSLATWPCAR